jgi:tetratricopeptide (TPR) repeat protein
MPRDLRSRWSLPIASVLSLLLLFLAYSNHFDNAFHFDDSHVIEQNLFIRDTGNIPLFFTDARTFSSLPMNATYRPLLTTSFAIDYALGNGLNTRAFHVTQFGLLVLLGMLLVVLFGRIMDLGEPHSWNRHAGLFAALLFCVHTANTETVNYLSSRSNILSTLGVVGAFCVYLLWPLSRRLHLYLIPMILGALAKISAVMFAPLLFVFVFLFEENLSVPDLFSRSNRRKAWRAALRVLPAVFVGLFLFFFVNFMNAPGQHYGGGSSVDYLMTQPFVWVRYLWLFFLPIGLTADTDWTILQHGYDWRLWTGLVVILVLLTLAVRCSRSPALRPVAFGLFWFVLALLPSSSLFPLSEVMNEHRIFFPYIGLSLAVVWGFALLADRLTVARPSARRIVAVSVGAIALLVAGGLAVGTFERNRVWATEESLWKDVVEKSPKNGRAWMNYGLTKMRQGRYEEAKRLFDQASIYNPNYAYLETNLGIVTDQLGNPEQAERHFLRALSLYPDFVEGHFYYARWLVEQGRSVSAIPHLVRAAELSPAALHARTLLMNLYAAKGNLTDLKDLAQDTLSIAPDDEIAAAYASGDAAMNVNPSSAKEYYNRGVAFGGEGRHLEAVIAYRKAVALDPDNADALNNLGWSLGKLGFFEEAVPILEKAVRLQPDYALARNNLAWVKRRLEAE